MCCQMVCLHVCCLFPRCLTAAWWLWCPNRLRPTTSHPPPAYHARLSADTVRPGHTHTHTHLPPSPRARVHTCTHCSVMSAVVKGFSEDSMSTEVVVADQMPPSYINRTGMFSESTLLCSENTARELSLKLWPSGASPLCRDLV